MTNRIRKIVENIKNLYKGRFLPDEPMRLHTTMKVGGNAELFAEPEDVFSLALVISECKKNSVDFFILGGGSNLIVSDEGFCGVVISMNAFSSIKFENRIVVCGSGVETSRAVEFFAENGISGMESFAGLPGTCGGACYMNARCYSNDISSKIKFVEYLDLENFDENSYKFLEKHIKMYHNNKDCAQWTYKHSPFMKKSVVITKVAFKAEECQLEKISELKAACESFIKDREQKGHFKAPSSGSVFKNNRDFGEPSGKLIDEAGLKGAKIGGAQIAPWHGNIIINTGNATCSDIKKLVQLAQQKVKERTGFMLECEVVFV
ncbi:UDP-N-acetylmuramate dehydrogenase [uncultured Treponema sp.]|uniref:UDP-N-acetylmuramate dehydrogenase n=1 Tax=uncultured Treponema sp. TaxID=162155 RepID=UPI0025FA2AEE|nr:UDP-N-acetylmuramate dehydrogenase [uncultured Treponema sp.]